MSEAWGDQEDYDVEEGCHCSFEHSRDEVCPECCWASGAFQGGTEECEFCPYAKYCSEEREMKTK